MARTAASRKELPSATAFSWNVLTAPWLELMDSRARLRRLSVLEALEDSPALHRIVAASPMDLFAIHRFLLTLLYWQAQDEAGVVKLRKALLSGRMPGAVIQGLTKESSCFDLFDSRRPFLQDLNVQASLTHSPAYLFAESATGTNVAHFDHGDDESARLCLACATLGLLRLIPWMQSGGPGLQPALHGAPPIMPLALGRSFCETLGLNLVPDTRPFGNPQWTGAFTPKTRKAGIALLEGLTWNARRVHLGPAHPAGACVRCGASRVAVVGPIAFKKNPACMLDKDYLATWKDIAAFHRADTSATVKADDELEAAIRDDLRKLFEQRFGKKIEPAPTSAVVAANPGHEDWLVVLPCTNPANNKSFDHRCEALKGFDTSAPSRAEFWHDSVPWQAGDKRALPQLESARPSAGVLKFVRLAAGLDNASWAVLEQAANRPLNHSPAAFDIFTGLYWPLRNRDRTLPSRNAAWLALKVMATAGRLRPAGGRTSGSYQPWRDLALRDSPAKGRVYPRAVPVGRHLEAALREAIRRHAQKPAPAGIDWPGLCQFMHTVTP
jgi:predicted outer membrane lipoprotein